MMKTLIRKTFILSFLFFPCTSLLSQLLSKKEFIRSVQEADILYYFEEDYDKASVLYESLLNIYPENSNLAAKLGICYLNIDGKNPDALRLLLKASLNIVNDDKEYLEYGEKAPLDTYLYLAIAYHKNDSLQKAVALFNDAKKRLGGTEIFREEYIDMQIRDCRYAIEMKKKPLKIISRLFVPWLTEYPGACNPVVSKNDSVFIFTQRQNGKTQIFFSYKSGTWKRPVNITKQLGGYDRFYSNSITGNGRLLIIYMNDGDDGNLYYSQRTDTNWTKIRSLGKPINTIYWESHGFILPDGRTMYLSSNRPGGEGDLDIWFAEKDDEGNWKQPVNCGNIINTPYNETTPSYDPSSNALLFSSEGHISMGGYDVFRSVNRNGFWTNPVGMPFAFNNPSENVFFILNNNSPGFITSLYNEKNNSRNIYSIVAEDPSEKITMVHGTISFQDGMNVDPNQIRIQISDLRKSTQLLTISLIDSISFKCEVKPGDYQIFVSHPGYKTDTINLNLPLYFSGNYISVSASLIPDKVFAGGFLSIGNILFEFDSYKLTDHARSSLDVLKTILARYPELKIEVAGYTDAKGSTEYNRKLADKRAQAVINYLLSSGLSPSRFAKKAFGESNFAAVNTNRDGSDNPEGRRYNRRVIFGIIDPQTGVIIRQESYTPQHLRQPYTMKYSIVLKKTGENLSNSYFRSLKMSEMLFIRSLKIDSVSLYILGVFYNRNDASKYLSYSKVKGFHDAYIVTQYEVNSASGSLVNPNPKARYIPDKIVYTIQLMATRQPVNLSHFKGIDGIREIHSEDGYFRYVYGEYGSYTKAKTGLAQFHESQFRDAYIRELNLLIKK
jgi:outer membrane protein OmpA-like peptidoglycan-associated protein/tetratricopeptide (TPR) repeat protein